MSTVVGVFVEGPSGAFHTEILNFRGGHFRGHLRVHSRVHFREHFLRKFVGQISRFACSVLF